MQKSNRSGLWITLAVIALIVVLFAVFVDLPAVSLQLRQADWRLLVAASGALLLGLAAYATRWRALLANKAGWLAAFHAGNTGLLLNVFIPLRVGEAGRIVMLSRDESVSLAEATSSFVVERLFEQIMRLSALGAAIVLGVGLTVSTSFIAAALAVVVLTFVALRWLVKNQTHVLENWPTKLARLPRVSAERARLQLAGFLTGLSSIAAPRQLLLALVWSLVAWACFWLFHLLILLALPLELNAATLRAISFGSLALAPPSATSQPGLYNAAIVAPLGLVGFDETLLTSYTVLLQALQIVWLTGLTMWALVRAGVSARELITPAAPIQIR